MKNIILITLLLATSLGCKANSNISTELTLVSDRLLRGFSLTDEEPSLIGKAAYGHESGFYLAGAGFTNIQINGTNEALIDAVIGYKISGNKVNWDFGYIRHIFTKTDDVDSGEWFVGMLFNEYQLHYYVNNDNDEKYIDFNSAHQLSENYKLHLHAGRLDSDKFSAVDFNDYSIGLSHSFKHFNLGLTYAYNDNKQALKAVAGSHIVLSLSKFW
ncbi:TorF family putative porin [Aliikangiella sp. IMCC44359]|uniref:TorF family putative porin n=1 Tax=Aliikangiella sp. IMCC44359 TaxID=3459125 RepID=UPI00403B31CC